MAIKTVSQNKAEIERIVSIIENHCLCQKLIHKGGSHYVVKICGFNDAQSMNKNKRLSLIDIAIHLEKLWIHSGIESLEKRIEKVKQYRIENNLF